MHWYGLTSGKPSRRCRCAWQRTSPSIASRTTDSGAFMICFISNDNYSTRAR